MNRRDAILPTDAGPDAAKIDGPWRIAESCRLCVAAANPGDMLDFSRMERFTTDLRQSGFPLSDLAALHAGPDLIAATRDAGGRPVDILLVDFAIDLDPAAAIDLRRVASSDPMIAGVSARHESGTIKTDIDAWRNILPPLTYVPFGDPRCLYIKGSVLTEFGSGTLAHPIDWDIFALTVNAYGFRMVRANHAVYRSGHAPLRDTASLAARAKCLEPDFPGARGAVTGFLSGTPEAATQLIEGLAKDADGRRTVIFDLTHIGAKRSGTSEVALALIRRATETWHGDWDVAVLAPVATHKFHFAPPTTAPRRIDPADPARGAAFIRIGQPFSWKEIDAAVRRAPALVFFMLDTIGLDCIRLAPDDLDALWRFTLAEADGLLFNSAFTRRQYERRFGTRPGQPRLASLHSLDGRDYAKRSEVERKDGSLLVIGNPFAHKRLEHTALTLAGAFRGRIITALGLPAGTIEGVTGYPSGALDDATIASLYGRADLVVYPSVYEGFGFPLVEALSHRKPILVRDLPPFAEIAAGMPESANIYRFQTDAELVALVKTSPTWIEPMDKMRARNWDDAVSDLRGILDEAVSSVDYDRVVRRIDFMRGRLAFIRQKPFSADAGFGEDLDRIAALAGRLASKAIYRLATFPGAGPMLNWLSRAARTEKR